MSGETNPKVSSQNDALATLDNAEAGAELSKESLEEAQNYAGQLDKAHLQEVQQRNADRALYTGRLFLLLVAWVSTVLGLIIATGLRFSRSAEWSLYKDGGSLLIIVLGGFLLMESMAWNRRLLGGSSPHTGWTGWLTLLEQDGKCFGPRALASVGTSLLLIAGCFVLMRAKPTFVLEQPVVLALIGGTTANIIGLFVFVPRYLFGSHKGSDGPRKRRRTTLSFHRDRD